MSRKAEFRPEVTRVKLNPEQAVLTCNCYNNGSYGTSTRGRKDFRGICEAAARVLGDFVDQIGSTGTS